ncbi:RNA-directed DNA polymerase from mobile element jockey [Trichonephila clavipes]|nr:RNA-directed DNA polymerase from mobile element jockey [Trichonephila clavipes]
MSKISPFAIHKTLIGIGGEPKSVKRLRSGDLLIETMSDLQTKSFLLAKTFFNSPVTVSPHKTLNSCRGVISEPDLLSTPDAEILEGFSDQGVIQVRRITIKRDSNIIPTKHIILTFNKPKLPTAVKAGYLHCKIRPYIPNPLRCFKCQRFGHSQTSCRGQLTCSRCASVGHSSTDCTLEPKCVNCTQSHPSDSKLCQKWKIEKKQIQEIKINKNISYFEARRLIVPQLTQTYAQAARPSTISTATQTDSNLSNIICPPLQCLTPISSKNPLPGTSSSVSTFSTSSSSTQGNLLPSPSGILPTIQISPLETETRSRTPPAKLDSVSTENLHESVPNESNSEHLLQLKPNKLSRNATPTEITTDDEDMITYDVEEEELEQDPFILPEDWFLSLTRMFAVGGDPYRGKVESGVPVACALAHASRRREAGVSPLLSIGWRYFTSDFLHVSTEEIKENMKAQKVCDVRRITIRRDGQVLNTKHLILTFNTPDLPQTVKMAYIRCPVRPYIPNPLRCFQCQRFWTFKQSAAVSQPALHVQRRCHGHSRPLAKRRKSMDDLSPRPRLLAPCPQGLTFSLGEYGVHAPEVP